MIRRTPAAFGLLLGPLLLLLSLPLRAHPDPRHTLEQLDEHLAAAPDDPELLRQKAAALLDTRSPDLATEVVAKLLQQDADLPANRLLDARVAIARGENPAALAKAEALVAAHPEFAGGWDLLAATRAAAGRQDEAIAAKLRFLELCHQPGPSDVMVGAAWLRDRGRPGDAETAIRVLDQGLARIGCLIGLQEMAIGLELGLQRYDSALRRVDALTARFRPSVALSLRRADILEAAGRFTEAAASCDAALALLDVLPAARKKSPSYTAQWEAVSRRKADNLAKGR